MIKMIWSIAKPLITWYQWGREVGKLIFDHFELKDECYSSSDFNVESRYHREMVVKHLRNLSK